MHLIVYTSETTLTDMQVEAVVSDIVATAALNNAEHGITGVLFYENRHFLQAIEGDESRLRATFAKIAEDPRHHKLSKIVDDPIQARAFPDWAMDTFYVDAPELVDSQTIKLIHKLYDHSFELNTKDLIDFVKRMIDEMDMFKILRPF